MSPDENSDSHYSITFEHNFHDELVIDYELVEATNNEEYESNEQDCMHREVDVGTKVQNSNIDTELQMLKCPSFNPIQNVQSFHRGYVTLLHEYQLGIVILLSLFQLFFTDKQLNSMVVNTNIYKQVKGQDRGCPWNPLTQNELKIWLGLIIYMGVHKISAVKDL
ncbi:7406_t:CDS:2 [Cetraspora pellucida]|uniref:7406_t:CDS:1 n=1 Tax=Cetraspora pellucida TaxID=1433469 RepID=A0ACA9MPV2_9GLOM|nr:7406_t:CDS:2 [Cetraspora pellucida]